MIQIRFTIEGNHLDIKGNPIPYMRLVRGHWKKGDEKYIEWGDYVRARFSKTAKLSTQTEAIKSPIPNLIAHNTNGELNAIKDHAGAFNFEKPIDVKKRKIYLDLKIYWHNKAHGDPDNIFKGIADALIHQDKNVDGSFASAIASDGYGRVEGLLTITDDIT